MTPCRFLPVRRFVLSVAFVVALPLVAGPGSARAQEPAAQAEAAAAPLPEGEAAWIRWPAISPDGRSIAFTYQGDLWRVPAEGGTAMRLTSHPAHDYRPVWSPDGSLIAFASDRYGAFQVYVMPATGGEPRRLTYDSAGERPYAFTPDGASVVFGAARLDAAENRQFPSNALPELYQVPVAGGRTSQLLTIPAEDVSFTPDGALALYHDRKGGENEWRKHHASSITRDLWVWEREADRHRRLTNGPHEARTPVVGPDGAVYYLSEAGGSYNVHRIPLAGGTPEQVTAFRGDAVRFLSAARDGTLAFGHGGLLYTLAPGATEARRVPVRLASDWQANDERVIRLAGPLSGLAVSPTAREIGFTFRGEVFASSVASGVTKRITTTPARESDVQFTPDSSAIVYASERDGRWGIWEARRSREDERWFFDATLIEERPLVVNERQNFQPILSPDGRRLAFVEDYHTLRVLDRETGDVVTLLGPEHIFSGGQFEWSPDGAWMLFSWAVPGRATRDIGVVRTDGSGEIHNLTRSGFQDTGARWVLGGRAMIWRSNRDGRRSLQATGSTEADVYAMFFTQEAWEEFQRTEEELELRRAGDEEDESDDEEQQAPEPLALDFENARERRARLTIHSSVLGDYVLSDDGRTLYYLTRFEGGYDLWRTNVRTRETERVLELGANSASMTWGPKHERLFMLVDGRPAVVDPEARRREAIAVNAEIVVSGRAERAAMFDQMWRRVRDVFYTRSFHGTDWEAVRGMYARFLPHVGNHHELTELLSEALGELNVSHSGARYNPGGEGGDETASLGIFWDQSPAAALESGIRIVEVMRGGPLDRAGFDIVPGTVLEALDGVELTLDTDLSRLLNRREGRNTRVRVRGPDGNVRELVVTPVSRAEEGRLRYDRWVERNRREVEDRSGGRLGYVHVQGMNDRAYRSTFEEVLGRHFDKEGIVVDTRFNPGGDLVADLQMFFSGRHFFEYSTDDRSSGYEPSFRWTRPTVLLAGEGNYSDGHCFAWAYQTLGLGPLIGMPVPGTCTFGGGQTLLDGISFGVPARGVKDAESGRFLENWQTEPDIRISNDPGVVDRGRDQQLERAVDELLRRVEG